MTLQDYLVAKFFAWQPSEPIVENRTKCDITLSWCLEPFHFIKDQLLYKVEKKNKMPPWVVVYSGGKTVKTIDNLPPRHPHKFRLKIILKTEAVPTLAERAVQFYGDEEAVYEHMRLYEESRKKDNSGVADNKTGSKEGDMKDGEKEDQSTNIDKAGDRINGETRIEKKDTRGTKWLESQWSEETWTSTDTDGTSAVCFCMAVRCGYIKQVQIMLEERPALIGIANTVNGFTPLATAVRKGDINTVRFLLNAGAELDQPSGTGQTALHLAVLAGNIPIVDLLLERGADFQARDLNGLRVEHYAVDSCSLDMLRHILEKGGDVHVLDNNGWTPLFRAVCQGAKTEMVEELVMKGSDIEARDIAGLPLTSVAKLLKNRHGRSRDSILRLVDSQYPHEKALAMFTRLTKKIYSVHSLLHK